MDGDFRENEPGYYTVQNAELIEDFDPDQYGNRWLNVKFTGDAETYMWLKKEPPVEGQKYYGHIEKTKSGKRLRFKTDKVPEAAQATPGVAKDNQYLKDTSDIPRSLVIELLKYYDVQSLYNSPKYTQMISLAQSLNDDIAKMIEGNRSGSGDGDKAQAHSSPTTPIEEVEKTAAGPLRSAWEERKDLPKKDEYQYTDEEQHG